MEKLVFYNTAMLDVMIKSFGDGFPQVLCRMSQRKSDNPNNIKQMIHRMRNGNKADYHGLWQLIENGIEQFTDGCIVDVEARYSHQKSSDKYNEIRYRLLNRTFYYNHENFFNEEKENVFAYLAADWLLKCNNTEPDIMPHDTEWKIEAFRPEYYTVFHDVLLHFEGNKTFYKWVIDDFYLMMGDSKQADEIIMYVFGKVPDREEVCLTFKKLKYQAGKRDWTTVDALLQNEQNDSFLMKTFAGHAEFLRAYQIFQARMFVAYILENLRAILPTYIGKWNKSFWQQIIHAYRDNLSSSQLKAIFLSQGLRTQEFEQKSGECEKHARYAGEFSDFANPMLTDMIRIPRK